MNLGYDKKLYILAFDHRGSFEKLVGGGQERIESAKQLIWEGFRRAVEEGVPRESAGILVDAQYGEQIARAAKAGGYLLAMPVEKSGQDEFDFEYGDRFGEQIEAYDPDFSKVLVRFNVDGDRAVNERQLERLRRLSEWLHEHDRKYLFELLVPATEEQLDSVGGDPDRYDEELRPNLMMEAIIQLQNGGVEPDIWKIEGIQSRDACNQIAQLVRREGRDRVSCIVLGRGASDAKVDAWLRAGAGVQGYVGFAIGRSIFGDASKQLAAEGESFDREAGAEQIAGKYRRFVDVYEGAGVAA
jgi:myo-inositol catabolism protein IolC